MSPHGFTLLDYSSNSSAIVGICVCKTTDGGTHSGILYSDSSGVKKFLHLAFHCYLRNDELNEINCASTYRGFIIPIDDMLIDAAHQMCELVASRQHNQSIPYGLYFRSSRVSKLGIVEIDKKENGLSCSTFIITILDSAGIDLLKLKQWEPRTEDIVHHKRLIGMLKQYQTSFKISSEHIENVEKEVGCIRYRPEELAAATTADSIPANFEYCKEVGSQILWTLPDVQCA